MCSDVDLKQIEAKLGISFSDKELLRRAFAHRSYTHDTRVGGLDNERLEFLGDAVLGLVVSDYLYEAYPSLDEGQLTRIKCAVVSESTLARVAMRLKLGSYMLLGRGEELSGGRRKSSLLSNVFEALTAAVYLDSNLTRARAFVLTHLKPEIEAVRTRKIEVDYKSVFQEAAQRLIKTTPVYVVASEHGPDHEKTFEVRALCGDKCYGSGVGRSKKDAEQDAARQALENLGLY